MTGSQTPVDLPGDPQAEIIAWLHSPATYGRDVTEVQRIDTHISAIFLAGPLAYKLKRAVRLPFLDFSTLELREVACRRELALNRRTAPGIYRGLLPISRDQDGRLVLGEAAVVVDWLVVMTRFAQTDLFDHLALRGGLSPEDLSQMADAIADLHRSAEIKPDWGGAAGMAFTIGTNAQCLGRFVPDLFAKRAVDDLEAASRSWLARLSGLLEARRKGGFVRLCHGDLHLGNICRFEGRPTLFDAIEFNEDFACIDVFYDIAFLIMDLRALGLNDAAALVFNRYLEHTDDLEALAALPLFLSLRAAIRAHVSALMAQTGADARRADDAKAYLAAAAAYLTPAQPRLLAFGGLSGSGKSMLARALAAKTGPAPGAVVLRSDVIRKHLMGVAPEVRLPEAAYSAEMTERTYAVLLEKAGRALKAGHAVIADAVFARPGQRDAIEALARSCRVPFDGLWLDARPEVLRQRIAARRNDASDATLGVLDSQLTFSLGAMSWGRFDTSGERGDVETAARRLLGL